MPAFPRSPVEPPSRRRRPIVTPVRRPRLATAQPVIVTGGPHAGEHGRVRFVRRFSRRAVVALRSGRCVVVPTRRLDIDHGS